MKKMSKNTKRTVLIAAATAVVFMHVGMLFPYRKAAPQSVDSGYLSSPMYMKSNSLSMKEMSDMNFAIGTADSATALPESTPNSTADSVLQGRKIIRSARLTIESKTFDSSSEILKNAVISAGGYIEDSYINATAPRNANYTIRLPAEKLDEFLDNTSSIGTVVDCSTSDKEITEQYYDTEARLKTLNTQEQRLLAILEKADTLSDVIELESRLSDVRYEIENLTGTLKKYDSLIAYSTVTIYLNEVMSESNVYSMPKTLGERISQTFSESFDGVKDIIENAIVAVIGGLPSILFGAAVFAVVVAVIFAAIKVSAKIYRKKHPETAAENKKEIYEKTTDDTNDE